MEIIFILIGAFIGFMIGCIISNGGDDTDE